MSENKPVFIHVETKSTDAVVVTPPADSVVVSAPSTDNPVVEIKSFVNIERTDVEVVAVGPIWVQADITSGNVTTALGFTPYNSTNPSGFITSAGTSAACSGNAATATTATNVSGGSVNATTGTFSDTITSTGNIIAFFSDDRLKTRHGKIENALEKLQTLDGFYYTPNEVAQAFGYEAIQDVGVSAQSVQAIMPEIVAPAPIDAQYLTVRYEKLVPLLIEAIKELTLKVEVLERK